MDIRNIIKSALERLGIDAPPIELEVTRAEAHGDISTPVAMVLAGQLKKPPGKIAGDIVNAIGNGEMFEKVEIAGPGFINFFLAKDYIHKKLADLLKDPGKFVR